MNNADALKVLLGSFGYNWQVQDHGDGTATIQFRVYNAVGRFSAYGGTNVSMGILATQHQYFYWEVTITY